ncbi:MAG: hypothetical protein QM820_62075 [Minicystis sp.]
MIDVPLTVAEVRNCITDGAMAYATFKNRKGHYGTPSSNSLESHVIAKLGEAAVEKWLQGAVPGVAIDALFRDPVHTEDCDLVARVAERTLRVEVKCWNHGVSWERGGRCVVPGQIDSITAHADVVVWCRLSRHLERLEDLRLAKADVDLMGWSAPAEIRARKSVNTSWTGEITPNHQIPVEAMHDVEELLQRLRA